MSMPSMRLASPVPVAIFALVLALPCLSRADEPSTREGEELLTRAERSRNVTEYEDAAAHFERFVTSSPSDGRAPRALSDAIVPRLGLGQREEATRDGELYVKLYAAKSPRESATVVVAIASEHARNDDWVRTRTSIQGSMTLIDKAPLDLRTTAHVLLARALAHTPKGARASSSEYAAVRALWSDPQTATRTIEQAWSDESEHQRDRHLGKALVAVGEALFMAAEEHRLATVAHLSPPTFAGPKSEAAMKAHLDGRVAAWIAEKRAALAGAEREYLHVLAIAPVPPPEWVVASAAQVGLMWAAFADEIRLVVPLSAQRSGKQLTPLGAAIEGVRRDVRRQHAAPALRKCLDLSVKFVFVSERSRACEAWLVANGELAKADEIVPRLRAAGPSVEPQGPLHPPR